MPIEGKLYPSDELQCLIGVKKQRISNIAKDRNWLVLIPGKYFAEDVEPFLMGRGIDPAKLKTKSYCFPDGATAAEELEG